MKLRAGIGDNMSAAAKIERLNLPAHTIIAICTECLQGVKNRRRQHFACPSCKQTYRLLKTPIPANDFDAMGYGQREDLVLAAASK